jgi:hypothetical protein
MICLVRKIVFTTNANITGERGMLKGGFASANVERKLAKHGKSWYAIVSPMANVFNYRQLCK